MGWCGVLGCEAAFASRCIAATRSRDCIVIVGERKREGVGEVSPKPSLCSGVPLPVCGESKLS